MLNQQMGNMFLAICDKDGDQGLSWDEWEKCQGKISRIVLALGMSPPTNEDFTIPDVNKDGVINMEEWTNMLIKINELRQIAKLASSASPAAKEEVLPFFNRKRISCLEILIMMAILIMLSGSSLVS